MKLKSVLISLIDFDSEFMKNCFSERESPNSSWRMMDANKFFKKKKKILTKEQCS